MCYSEKQNKYLWFSANELLELIEKLAQKIVKFIKIKNLFGNQHKYAPAKISGSFDERTDFKEELENAITSTEKILRKKYIVDIMDDGAVELEFPDYTDAELKEIAASFISAKKYTIEDAAIDRLLEVVAYYRNRPNFANARTMRNIIDQVIMNQNLRVEENEDDFQIIKADVDDYIADEGIDIHAEAPRRRIGF